MPRGEVVLYVVVYVDQKEQKFSTVVEVNDQLPPILQIVGSTHAIRDLLNSFPSGVLEEKS